MGALFALQIYTALSSHISFNIFLDNTTTSTTTTTTWMLLSDEFRKLTNIWHVDTDLFASAWNAQLPRFVSWLLQPQALAANAFALNWSDLKGYAFPPFALIPRCLDKIRRDQADVVLVCPLWQSQAWFPLLLQISAYIPLVFRSHPFLIHSHLLEPHPLLLARKLQLSAWKLSGNDSKVAAFHQGLLNSSW
jgi:hypothetical protein